MSGGILRRDVGYHARSKAEGGERGIHSEVLCGYETRTTDERCLSRVRAYAFDLMHEDAYLYDDLVQLMVKADVTIAMQDHGYERHILLSWLNPESPMGLSHCRAPDLRAACLWYLRRMGEIE